MRTEDALGIIDKIIKPQRLNDVQELVFCQSWCGKSYQEIALEGGYDPDYIKDVGSKLWQLLSQAIGERVTKRNLHAVLRHYTEQCDRPADPQPCPTTSPGTLHPRQDCTEAVNISKFYGRHEELATVKRWILQEDCALIAILGMGGMGKTAFSVQLVQQISPQFDCVIWRSLRHAPSLRDTLAKLIHFLSYQPDTPLPKSTSFRVEKLLHYFQQQRCLVIFDNFESLFEPQKISAETPHSFPLGCYRQGYESYDEILQQVGELVHPSCLIITAREKPETIATLEGNTLRVRVLELTGLSETAAQKLLQDKGLAIAPDRARELVQCYHGNPLALKKAATAILELYDGSLTDFLAEKNPLLPGIKTLLDEQFQRLSMLEAKVMYWLAIAREPMSVTDLLGDIVPPESKPRVIEALEFLRRRSLIEKTTTGFTQSALVIEYVTKQLIEIIYEEIVDFRYANHLYLNHYALIQANAKEDIKTAQIQAILDPLVERLQATYPSQEDLAEQLNLILVKLRAEMPTPGYGAGNILNLLAKLDIDLTGADFSDLTVWQADLREVPLHGVNFAGSNLAKSVFSTIAGQVVAVAVNREGEWLATGDTKGIICLWRVKDRQPMRHWKGHDQAIASLAFSGNGQWLASCGRDRQVKLWQVATGNCLQSWLTFTGMTPSVAFSRDDRILAIAQPDKILACWDVCTGEPLSPRVSPHHLALSLAFSFSASDTYPLGIKFDGWLTNRPDASRRNMETRIYTISASAFSQGGAICIGSTDGKISLGSGGLTNCINAKQGDCQGESAIGSDSQQSRDRILDPSQRSQNREPDTPIKPWQAHRGSVSCVAWNADGSLLVSSGDDRSLKLWEVSSGQCVKSLTAYDDGWESLAASPDGKWLASGSAIAQIALWNLQTGQCAKILQAHHAKVSALAFSPDGTLLASSSEDAVIQFWSVGEFQPVRTLPGVNYALRSLAFSPHPTRFACPDRDRTLRIWDTRSDRCWKILPGDGYRIFAVAWSPDGAIVASASDAPAITLWNVETGECLHTLHGHLSLILSLAFSPDGRLLASASRDRTLRVWNVSTGQCFDALHRQETAVSTVAFSPQGTRLASGSSEGILNLWNLTTGACSLSIHAHTDAITSLTFTPDGHTLITASRDATIQCWNLNATQETPTPVPTRSFRLPRLYEQMNIAGVTGLSESTLAMLKALGAKG
ncbi:NB-ARC domain-containing protein [Phormidium sp. CCY1219]|uniref:WD40 domain-containing protein n=1 Tax=Phormidium sp. CCY1219 TaxID=2886104 RepID=UPI002D1E6CFA|nr:NB-ARC domain-containing protein [Phormidium sp. CCY1219]MEB3831710.1 NACHT domain-containing protein [Phormidium sp. CCY1219]